MSLLRQRPPILIPTLCLALSLTASLASAGNSFCGGRANPTVPSDLENGVGDQSLEYMVAQPASMLTCSKGYMLAKCGDNEGANVIFDKCIAAGYAGAMIWKARLLEEGSGVEKDLVKATELLHRAAVSGDPAYGPIGKMHYATALQLGSGVEKNEAEARKWFEAAAAEGSEEARDFLKTGYHTGSRGYNTLGAGTPTAAALAKLLPPDSSDAPQTAQASEPAVQGRTLVNDAQAAPPVAAAPPQAAPAPESTFQAAEVHGQKLEKRAALPAPGLPQASAGFGLLLVLSFLVGIVRRKRQDRATPAFSHLETTS